MSQNTETKAQNDDITFDDLQLGAPILKAIHETGYTSPTPIQAQAIPLALTGLDLMAGAQTGTGKTAAFSLPTLQKLLPQASTSTSPAKHPIRALVLAPTRELAIQVQENVETYAKYTNLRSLVVYGGVDIKKQTPALKAGVEILVATPGRLLDHIEQKTVSLNQVQMLVLDEADRMLDMGFMPDLKKILALLPAKRQNMMFSATFSKEIKKLADDFLSNPTLIEVARSNATNENVTQQAYSVSDRDKQKFLIQLLKKEDAKQVIVFTKTKLSANRLTRALQNAAVAADAIHGDKSQKERIVALDAFKDGTTKVLVATDVAARGLDISDLPMVINYEIPSAAEDYVHRIGRTGRAGAKGVAISLVSGEEEKYFDEIEKLIKKKVERQKASLSREPRQASPRRRKASSNQPGESTDPFFFEPYAPKSTTEVAPKSEKSAKLPVKQMVKKRKKPVAALLGGLAK